MSFILFYKTQISHGFLLCSVGRRISTKKPRHDKEPKRPFDPWRVLFKDDKDRSDLTEEYKYKEGRDAVYVINV